MKKKLMSILFLTAILFVSCSNENKTGPSSKIIQKYIINIYVIF